LEVDAREESWRIGVVAIHVLAGAAAAAPTPVRAAASRESTGPAEEDLTVCLGVGRGELGDQLLQQPRALSTAPRGFPGPPATLGILSQ
jgi:hypothetical protein